MYVEKPTNSRFDNIARQDVHFSLDIGSQNTDAQEQQQAEDIVGEPLMTHTVPADVLLGGD